MNLLLDTHVLLWCLDDDAKISPTARKAIIHGRNQIFISAASIWEITIKRELGKLQAPQSIKPELEALRFTELPISIAHTEYISTLPNHHKDPFDRMLVAQALTENLTLVTRDALIKQYDVNYIEA